MMARKPKYKVQDELVKRARDYFQDAYDADNVQNQLAIEDVLFAQVEGHQWGDDGSDKPKFEINRIGAAVNQVSGEWRNSQVRIKVRPVSHTSTNDMAETLGGVIRDIENQSNAKAIYNNAFDLLVNSGKTAWRVTTEPSKDDPFGNNQDIRLKHIRDPLTSVYVDPMAQDPNKRDARYIFVTSDIPKTEFAEMYPNSAMSDFSTPKSVVADRYGDWVSEDSVRVAEFWERVPVQRKVVKMSDGRVLWFDDVESVLDEMAARGVFVVDEASIDDHKIIMHVISGAEVLSGPHEWAGRYIPVVIAYGYNSYINGTHYYHGIVRHAKDAQSAYNWATSSAIESAAQTPNDPYWMTPTQAEGFEGKLSRMKTDNAPIQFYNPDPEAPGIPQRSGTPQVNQALVMIQQQAEKDLQAVIGRTGVNTQDDPGSESGRAVLARQKQQDMGTAVLFSNMQGAIGFTAEILLDLIPRVMDTERVMRVIGEDGSTETVWLNKTEVDKQTGKKVTLNDVSIGRYEVVSDVAPSFASQRSEALAFLTQLAQSSPDLQMISADLIAKNADFADASELQKRMRKMMIKNGAIEPNEQESKELAAKQPQGPDPMTLLQLQALQVNMENVQAQTEQIKASAIKTMADANKSAAEAESIGAQMSKMLAETNKTLQEINNLKASMMETVAKAAAVINDSAIKVQANSISVTPELAKLGGEMTDKAEDVIQETDIETINH
jgi:hypothetical protein